MRSISQYGLGADIRGTEPERQLWAEITNEGWATLGGERTFFADVVKRALISMAFRTAELVFKVKLDEVVWQPDCRVIPAT